LGWYGCFYPWMKPMPMGKSNRHSIPPEKQLMHEPSSNKIRPSEEEKCQQGGECCRMSVPQNDYLALHSRCIKELA